MTGGSGSRGYPGTPATPPQDGPDWGRIAAIFHEAIELPPAERVAFVDRASRGHPGLRERLRELLASFDDGTGEGLDGPGGAGGPEASTLGTVPDALDPARTARLLAWARNEPEPGDRVGRYRIVRHLGRGGMGTVHLAHDPLLDRPVALKFLPYGSRNPARGAADRLVEEARAASALDHPHIGTVYEIAEDEEGRPFLAMACYEGGTLRERLSRGPLPTDAAVRIARQVAEGLAAAHAEGIVHRDIKPENLLFDRQGLVKIVDFGIARSRSTSGDEDPSRGTLAYMSPEQVAGEPPDPRSDLWSLGVVLFEMLTGERPVATTDLEGRAPIPTGSLPPPRRIPSELQPILRRMLSPDPSERFPTATAVADVLRRGPRAWTAGTKLSRAGSRPLATAAVGGGMLLLLLALAVGLLDRPRVTSASGSAAGSFQEAGWVLVADFEAGGEFAELALVAREALVVDLQQSSFMGALSRARTQDLLERMGHPRDTPVRGALAREVAVRAGAGAVLEATVARAGTRYVLSGRGVDPSTGEEFFLVRTTAGERRLLGAVERLSREMRARLGETRAALAASRPLPDVTTRSLEALRLYAEADRVLLFDPERSRALLEEAIERDPDFAMAHRLAGAAASNRLSFSEAREHLIRAWELRDRLPERERRHLEVSYEMNVRLDPTRAEAASLLLLERFPDDVRGLANLGAIRQSWLDDPEGALEAYLATGVADPEAARVLPDAIRVAFLLGRSEVVDSLTAVAGRSPGLDGFLVRWEIARAFGTGDVSAAIAGCDALLSGEPGVAPQADDDEVCGSMEVAAGRLESATARLEAVQDRYRAAGRHRNLAHAAQSLVVVDELRAGPDAAIARLLATLELLPADALEEPDRFITRTNLRIQALLLGRPDVADRIGAAYPPHPEPDHWFGQGGEALVAAAYAVHRGDAPEALRQLDGAFPPGVLPIGWRIWRELLRARAFESLGELDAAARHFERAAHPGFLPMTALTKDRIHLPLALEALAAVNERRGDRDGAVAARARLTALRAQAPPP